MRLCGHTMGTPALSILQSIDLFAQIGLEGIEVRCAANGHLNTETITEREAETVREHAARRGLQVVCLTPYYKDFATDEAARESLEGLRLAVRAARWMGCGLVRALAGIWPVEGQERAVVMRRTVEGLRRAGELAADAGVTLALENHVGTLAFSAQDTAEVVDAVGHPHVRVLLDYYWNVVAGDDDLQRVIDLLGPHTVHCHAKNMVWTDGKHETVLLEDGVIDWAQVLGALDRAGYSGFLSDEYEKFWKPEFPEPQAGMSRNAEHLRGCLAKIG